jgi:AAA domain-containing protein
MRVGISGTHGTGKTTLAEALCAHLPGHVAADEPYYLLEEQGHEFGFPPALEDYRALLACSLRSLSPPLLPGIVFDRTPLDYLAYMAATGADPCYEADAATLRPALASLDLLVITLITPETEQVLPAAEMPRLRSHMNDALLDLVYDDPLNAWADIPVLELTGPLDGRLDAVLAALNQSRHPHPPAPNARMITDRALAPLQRASPTGTRGTGCLRTPL